MQVETNFLNKPFEQVHAFPFESAWMLSPWGIAAVNSAGNVELVNPAFERCTGVSANAIMGLGEASLDAILGALALERRRIEVNSGNLRAFHFVRRPAASVAHDLRLAHFGELLREPLATIFGFAELLLTQNYEESVRRELTATLLEQVESMSNLINEELDVSKNCVPMSQSSSGSLE